MFETLQWPNTTTECKKQLRKIMLFYCYYSFYLYFCMHHFNGQIQQQRVRNNKTKSYCSIVNNFFICNFIRITSTAKYNNSQ